MFEIACKKLEELSDEYEVAVLVRDNELIDIAKKYNVDIINRSVDSCDVDGPWSLMFRDVGFMKSEYLMFLNPSVIFLTTDTIRNSLEEFQEFAVSSATSVKPFKNWLYSSMGDMIVEPDMSNLSIIEGLLQPANCFHICKKTDLLKKDIMLQESHLLIDVPVEETIDVDTPQDYEFAKWKYENSH